MLQQGFPNVSSPVVDDRGFIQQAWLQLLISLWTRTGSSQGASIFSSGDLKESAVPGAQSGWLECDGSAVSRSQFSSLFGAIGTIYGSGDGSTTFNLPDYRGRFRIGTSGSFPLGSTGGSSTQALSVANLASHDHGLIDPGHIHNFTSIPHTHTITDPGHLHTSLTATSSNTAGAAAGTSTAGNTGSSVTGITINPTAALGVVDSANTGITMGLTGNGTPFSIMPPYTPVTVLIKI